MRGIIFALLITFVGSQIYYLEPGFSDVKTYVYHYKGVVLSGLPQVGLTKSGLRLTCVIEISRMSKDNHILKVLSPKLDEFNGVWREDSFTKAPKLTQQIALCFTQVFKFEYRSGHIGNIYAHKDIPVLCINIVKGILNLLQITTTETQSTYEIQEPGIGGTCHTRYVVQEDKEKKKAIISRNIDLNNCADKVVKNIGMAYVRPCATCPVEAGNTKGSLSLFHKLKHTDTGALIVRAVSLQIYEISPFNEPGGTAFVEARQKLTLNKTISNQESIPDNNLQNHGSLHYQFPEDLPQMAVHLLSTKSPKAGIVETLQQLMQLNQLEVHEETPIKFLELIDRSRVVNLEDLESLWKQFADTQQYRYWLLSGITAAGTTNTFMFLKQIIQNEDLSVLESAVTLTVALHLTKTNSHTLQAAADLITSHAVEKSLILRKLAYLAYGSMICRHCSGPSSCSDEMLQPLHDLASNAANKSHEEDMILALKAIGNAGLPHSIKYIKKFLPCFSPAANDLPERIYMSAVLALRKIARKQKAKVQEIVFQIFQDSALPPEVRMAACVVFFETKPALPFVSAMASFVQKGTDLQVSSFVYSHMLALTANRVPQLENLSSACRIAIKLMDHWMDSLSFRYSKVVHIEGYSSDHKFGTLGRVYLMNTPNSVFPSAVIAKIRGFYATSAMDVIEVVLQLQGLTDIWKRHNAPFTQHATYTKIKALRKLLREWKELSLEKPLVSASLKLFSHDIVFGSVDQELILQVLELLTKPARVEKLLKDVITMFQKDLTGTWTQPVFVGELRHIVPTCVGFPVEFGLYSSSLVHTKARVHGHISPPLTDGFRFKQLYEVSVGFGADINSSVSTHLVAVMGINTPYFQSGLEFHAKFHANMPLNFDARIDMKEEKFTFETTPVQQEIELLSIRTKPYAVSRTVDEPRSAKMSPVLPLAGGPDALDQWFKLSEGTNKNCVIKQGMDSSQIYTGDLTNLRYMVQDKLCSSSLCIKLLGYENCLTVKGCDPPFQTEVYLHTLVEAHEVKLAVKPEAARTKIQLEIKRESKTHSKTTTTTHLKHSEEEHEHIPDEDQSSEAKDLRDEATKMSKSLRHRNPPSRWVAALHTIHGHEVVTRIHLAVNADLHSSRPTLQIIASNILEMHEMEFCANVSIRDSQKAEGSLRWGQNCEDYRILTSVAYEQYAGNPSMTFKVGWFNVPVEVEYIGRWFASYAPGIAYMFGFPERNMINPPREVSLTVILAAPRSCAIVLRLPNVTIFGKDIVLPFPIPVIKHREPLPIKSPAWTFISDVPSSVLENLKAHCTVSQDGFKTFNDVHFNSTMPTSCYHVMAQDCTSELKFLVMAKGEESNAQKTVHIKLASHEIDMYPSHGLVKLRIDGIETPTENLPYSSNSDVYVLITHDKDGLLLKAPEMGIEKLYYDGHMLKIQVPFWMMGKTCGICGRFDAEYEQEYKMPSGYVAQDAGSFVQSWMLPERSCVRDNVLINQDQELKKN